MERQIYNRLISYGICHEVALWITAQTKLETGNYTSQVFNDNRNLFGMKQPKKRPTTCRGNMHGHAQYLRLIESIADYMIYLTYMGFTQNNFKTLTSFKTKFKTLNYAEAPNYTERIDNIYNNLLNKY